MSFLAQQEVFDGFVQEFNDQRPHEGLQMKMPAEIYAPSTKAYSGLQDLEYPFHDRTAIVTSCGRVCLHNKKINLSHVFSGQKVGLKEVDDNVWLVSFIDYDLGYIDLEEKSLQPLENPFEAIRV